MDDLDRKILSLLAQNARMPVKEIAEHVSLTSPAVSSRIHRLEADGIIGGYTVVLKRPAGRLYQSSMVPRSLPFVSIIPGACPGIGGNLGAEQNCAGPLHSSSRVRATLSAHRRAPATASVRVLPCPPTSTRR